MTDQLDSSTKRRELPPIWLNKKQTDFIKSQEEFTCIKGTWGCGKSLAGILAVDRECTEIPHNLYLVIRKEYVDLRDSTMKDWEQIVGRKIIGNDVKYPNGSIVMFRHGEDINALKNANLGGALMVQAEEMTEEDFWFLKGRLRRKEGTRRLRVECNYDGHNWIYKLFNVQKVGKLILTNTFDNEKNLPAEYIPALMKMPKKIQERHLYGSDADMEGAVFDEFSEARHFLAPFSIPEGWERIIVLDHGVTNPTAVLWIAIDFDGKLYIYDEHYEAGKLISYHAEKIKDRDNKSVSDWLIDPSCVAKTNQRNGQLFSVIDEYFEQGINFRPADNNVLAGINRVQEYFKSDRLFIFKNCVNLKSEIDGYKWDKQKYTNEKNEPDKPRKHKDHACDAMRYGVMSRPQLPQVKEKKIEGSEAHYEWLQKQQDQMAERMENL